jgi:hypothetical protein
MAGGVTTMKRFSLAALALILLIGLQPQSARAASADPGCNNGFISWLSHGQDCHLFYGGVGIGIGTGVSSYYLTKKHGTPPHRPMSAGMAYGVTTYACAVAYPFVGTWLLNRPLTPREMYIGVGECVVPFLGGWLVDQWLPHTAWIDGTPPKLAKHH